MKKLLFIIAVLTILFTSCEKSDHFFAGKYLGVFKYDDKQESGFLDFKYGPFYKSIDNPIETIDSFLLSTDTIMTIDSLSSPGVYDTSYTYLPHYRYDTITTHNYTYSIDTAKGKGFFLNNYVEMKRGDDEKKFSCKIENLDSISTLIKSIPALYKLQLCDSTQILDQIIKKIEVSAEFYGGSVQSILCLTTNNETDSIKNVEFYGNDH